MTIKIYISGIENLYLEKEKERKQRESNGNAVPSIQ
jgi:hypothetical protein